MIVNSLPVSRCGASWWLQTSTQRSSGAARAPARPARPSAPGQQCGHQGRRTAAPREDLAVADPHRAYVALDRGRQVTLQVSVALPRRVVEGPAVELDHESVGPVVHV